MKKSGLLALGVFFLLTILVAPTIVLADGLGGKLWFYSYEPPIPLPDPETSDPNWQGSSGDPWIHESIVESIGFLPDTTVNINEWLGARTQDSNNTWVVVVVNQAGAAGISQIRINGTALLPAWTTSTTPPGYFNDSSWSIGPSWSIQFSRILWLRENQYWKNRRRRLCVPCSLG
jgi:hypothetical protein